MSAMSDYLEDALLKAIFRNTDFAAPDNLYVALHTAAPNETTPASEVTGNNYARVTVTTGTAGTGVGSGWNAPVTSGTGKLCDNAGVITFPTPSGSWGTVTHFAIWDSATNGQMLLWGALTISKTISQNDVVQFNAGDLDITFE